MSDDYGDVDTLVSVYLPSVSDADKPGIRDLLTSAYRTIDSRTRRQPFAFLPSPPDGQPLVFYGEDSPVLLLSDFIPGTITTVTGPQPFMPPGWVVWERRDETAGAYRRGVHTATGTDPATAIKTARVVWKKGVPFTVTARWGFAAIPAEITLAGYLLARDIYTQAPGQLSGPVGDLRPQPTRRILERVDELIAPYVLPDAIAEEEGGEIERGELLDADFNPWRDPFSPGGNTRF